MGRGCNAEDRTERAATDNRCSDGRIRGIIRALKLRLVPIQSNDANTRSNAAGDGRQLSAPVRSLSNAAGSISSPKTPLGLSTSQTCIISGVLPR